MLTFVVHGMLLALHAFLLAWAVMGLIEFVAPSVPWPRVSNPLCFRRGCCCCTGSRCCSAAQRS
jgi:hypothetical protein